MTWERTYVVSGRRLSLDFSLPLLPTAGPSPQPKVTVRAVPAASGPLVFSYDLRRGDGAILARRFDGDGGPVLRTPDGYEFLFQSKEGEIGYSLPPVPAGDLLGPLLLNGVFPLFLSASEDALFHAAVLDIGADAVGVFGDSGAGKSTLTAAWILRGGEFLSDDWISMASEDGQIACRPCLDVVRLRAEAFDLLPTPFPSGLTAARAGGKLWLTGGLVSEQFARKNRRLAAMVWLRRGGPSEEPLLREMVAAEAMKKLLRALILWDRHSPESWRRVLEMMRWMTASLPFFELLVPSGRRGLEAALCLLDGLRALNSKPVSRGS